MLALHRPKTHKPSSPPNQSQGQLFQPLTNAEELEQAWKVSTNTVGSSYNLYKVTELSDQKDKFGRCSTKINQPMSDSSCGNLNKQAAICLGKQQEGSKTCNLASVGITGTGDIDPKEVPQLCAVWCAEATCPFYTLVDASHKAILHPAVLKHLPTRKAVSKDIHLLYSAIQDSYRTILKEQQVIYQLAEDQPDNIKLKAMPLEFILLTSETTWAAQRVQQNHQYIHNQHQECLLQPPQRQPKATTLNQPPLILHLHENHNSKKSYVKLNLIRS
ncbi:hypothetical protein PGT21_017960 [Puccinia graminis f. sp. tritici]|uniref:Uncharacterized protein n=1 Tax=Puccinia graminis f. sp. tritici TaxID=56615 RepID=A0A5B0LXN2_PUCGR|nr:hypothetical protein PGT21_017960 [Puccinia graminis f. sp. tritici]